MIIKGINLPSIGFIRAKDIGGQCYLLSIYPVGPGPLAGVEPATMLEVEVDEGEVRRIRCLAPHLLLSNNLNRGLLGVQVASRAV